MHVLCATASREISVLSCSSESLTRLLLLKPYGMTDEKKKKKTKTNYFLGIKV